MNDQIVSTRLLVSGVRTTTEVNRALQALYNVFADLGLGQAAFEVTNEATAELWIKHLDSVTVDVDALNVALTRVGDFRIVG